MAQAIKMSLEQVMAELEAMGTAQNRKTYARHGAGDNLFGVSFANLGVLKKKIKKDHELALALWDTGNMDARCLATMIADPESFSSTQANAWVRGNANPGISGLVAAVAARTSWAPQARKAWIEAKGEFVQQAGWSMVSAAMRDAPDTISDEDGKALLERIEANIHQAPNRARESMNGALIALACAKPVLTELAIAASKRIGKVVVDHGDTSCKTPDAIPYIEKTLARQRARERGKSRA